MSGRPWTDEELGFLGSHPEWSARRVGESLERGMQSVQHKRNQIRDGWTPLVEPWTEDEVDFVRETPHLTAAEVAKHLGRTTKAIENRRHFLVRTEGMTFNEGKRGMLPNQIGNRRLLAKTCIGCGLLLDASWFGISRSKRQVCWHPRCTRCRPRNHKQTQQSRGNSARQSEERLQQISLPFAHRNREPWIEADHPTLSDPDLTALEKAVALGRTYKSVRRMVSVCGYKSRVGRGDPMKGVWVIDNPNAERLAG